jgi:MFS family permease
MGIVLTGMGMWFKALINVNVWFFMLGNTFAGFGQPFFLNSSSLLALTWFSDANRALATTFASMANNVGNAVGSIFPTIFVKSTNPEATWKDDIQKQLLLQAIIVTPIVIFNIFAQKSKPPTPPSANAQAKETPFSEGFKLMLNNGEFIKLAFYYGMMNFLYGCCLSLLSQWTRAYDNPDPKNSDNFTTMQIGFFNCAFLIGGITGSFIVGYFLGKTKAYKFFCIFVPITTIICLTIINYTLSYHSFSLTLFTAMLGGASILPAIPVTLEFAAFLTFPVNASNSAGACYVVGQFHSFALTMIIQFIMESKKKSGNEK